MNDFAKYLDKDAHYTLNTDSRTKPCRDDKGRFTKGMEPWNKGYSYNPDNNHTRFKHGHIPHNIKPIGTIRIVTNAKSKQQYKQIKLPNGKWQLLHRYIWEQHHPHIAKGYIVCFKDKNPLNCDIDNLYLVSKSENIRRNSDNFTKCKQGMKDLWDKEKLRVAYGLKQKTKLRVR